MFLRAAGCLAAPASRSAKPRRWRRIGPHAASPPRLRPRRAEAGDRPDPRQHPDMAS